MKIVYFGTPEPSAKILELLLEHKYEILCVVTQPDRPRGRGQKLSFSAVKEVALRHGLPLEQPEEVKNNSVFKTYLQSLGFDLGIVVAYGKILPKEILVIPRMGFINVHASLLPKYRGAAPIPWALLKGEEETGVTIFKLTELLDAGPIVAQRKLRIEEEDNTETLTRKLFALGAELLLESLPKLEKGEVEFIPQNEAEVTFAPSLTKESGEIDWHKSAFEIHNRVRALYPWPTAHTFYRGKRLKILRTRIMIPQLTPKLPLPGSILQIVKEEGFVVATGAGGLLILEVLPEAGRRMKAYDFVMGHGLREGDTFPS
jgi:methionyl-tRNA formyltransferase